MSRPKSGALRERAREALTGIKPTLPTDAEIADLAQRVLKKIASRHFSDDVWSLRTRPLPGRPPRVTWSGSAAELAAKIEAAAQGQSHGAATEAASAAEALEGLPVRHEAELADVRERHRRELEAARARRERALRDDAEAKALLVEIRSRLGSKGGAS
jgi:hypothetical protein